MVKYSRQQEGHLEGLLFDNVGVLESVKTNCRQRMEVALLSMAIVVILMLLLLPTIFYHLPLTSVSIFVFVSWLNLLLYTN